MNRKSQYRDMEKYQAARNRQRLRYYRQTANAENSHQPWTVKEIDLAISHIMPDMELSKLIGRSVASIQMQRNRQKKLEKDKAPSD